MNKVVKISLYVVAAFVAVVVLIGAVVFFYASSLSEESIVIRSVQIDAPAELVYDAARDSTTKNSWRSDPSDVATKRGPVYFDFDLDFDYVVDYEDRPMAFSVLFSSTEGEDSFKGEWSWVFVENDSGTEMIVSQSLLIKDKFYRLFAYFTDIAEGSVDLYIKEFKAEVEERSKALPVS